MKNQLDFVRNYSRNSKLAEAVLNQLDLDWEELIEYPEDYQDASAGVSGFIYYDETVEFAEKNLTNILSLIDELSSEYGYEIENPYSLYEDEQAYYNWMAWFALENTIQEIISYLE